MARFNTSKAPTWISISPVVICRINRFLWPEPHSSRGGNHKLVAEFVGLFMNSLIVLHVKHELRHTETVTHVDKQHAAVITTAMHPSHQRDGLAILFTR